VSQEELLIVKLFDLYYDVLLSCIMSTFMHAFVYIAS